MDARALVRRNRFAGFEMVTETAAATDKIRCDACPVMCYIKPGAAGACDRYANHDGKLVRVDPHIILERTIDRKSVV